MEVNKANQEEEEKPDADLLSFRASSTRGRGLVPSTALIHWGLLLGEGLSRSSPSMPARTDRGEEDELDWGLLLGEGTRRRRRSHGGSHRSLVTAIEEGERQTYDAVGGRVVGGFARV